MNIKIGTMRYLTIEGNHLHGYIRVYSENNRQLFSEFCPIARLTVADAIGDANYLKQQVMERNSL